MPQGHKKICERRERRKDTVPETVLLGHKVKNLMTVISFDVELSVYYNNCGRRLCIFVN